MGAAMRRVLARATIVLFALRALVPVGFMPDLDTLGAGHLDIVLCTGHGPVSLTLDANGVPAKPHRSPGADCPFGMALGKGFVAPAAPALPYAIVAAGTTARTDAARGLRPPSQGPPLGSRAPPVHSV